jgi:hypothetical protein
VQASSSRPAATLSGPSTSACPATARSPERTVAGGADRHAVDEATADPVPRNQARSEGAAVESRRRHARGGRGARTPRRAGRRSRRRPSVRCRGTVDRPPHHASARTSGRAGR